MYKKMCVLYTNWKDEQRKEKKEMKLRRGNGQTYYIVAVCSFPLQDEQACPTFFLSIHFYKWYYADSNSLRLERTTAESSSHDILRCG